MIKRFILLTLFILAVFSLQAHSQEKDNLDVNNIQPERIITDDVPTDSVQTDTATHRKNGFMRAIKKFLNFSDFDTLYISPNRYNYALMTTHYSNFEYYTVTSSTPKAQRLTFSPNPHNKIGFYFGWRWIFLGWSFDVEDVFSHRSTKNRGTDFDLSLYSSKLGIDIFYRRTGNNYKIHKIKGFKDNSEGSYSIDFEGLKVDIKGVNLYYIFNNKKFSYPAAFSQSTNQRKNAGSMIAGFSISTHKLDFDFTQLPEDIQANMNPSMKVDNIKYTNANISFGYAYNWVFARNCLACLSLTPALSLKVSDVNSKYSEANQWYRKFSFDFLCRAGVVYNNGKYFIGTSFVGKNYNYRQKNFSFNNGYGTLQVYLGFNFNTRKEYRTKK